MRLLPPPEAQAEYPVDTYETRITFPLPVVEIKGWGHEEILINCPDYCAKILHFKDSSMGSLHYHARKRETWRVLEGEIELVWVDTATAERHTKTLKTGEMVDIPRLCPHQVRTLKAARIMEVSTPHYVEDSYRVSPGDSQAK